MPSRRFRAAVCLLAATAVAGCAIWRRAVSGPPRHLVLVTIDTLRADRLGCYGGKVATPNIDRIAADGAMAPRASVAAPQTAPSHATILTGLNPTDHGVRDNVASPLAAGVPTLAEVLQKAGFQTAGFVSAVVLDSKSGLNRGFQTYSDTFGNKERTQILNDLQKRGDLTVAEALAWMEGHRDARTFVWVHLYDPHDPYTPPEPYASRYAGQPYEGEVAWTDELVGRLDAGLRKMGRADDTLLVLTADHGEGLGDHGEARHGYFLYESTLHVPLMLRGPGIAAGTRLKVTASSVDLFPTMLDLLGIAVPRGGAGRSLAPALTKGEALAELATYAESLTPLFHFGWSDLRALRDGRWKYIQAPRPELYDLERDPGETKNLLAEQPARVDALRGALARRLEHERKASLRGQPADIDPERLEQLGALGYLGVGQVAPSEHTGADPKDKLEDFKVLNVLMSEGLQMKQAGDYTGAVARLQRMTDEFGIDNYDVHFHLGEALSGLHRLPEAEKHFARAAEQLPSLSGGHCRLAETRLAQRNPAGALAALVRGEESLPRNARVKQLKGHALRALGRMPEAIEAYAAAAALAPQNGMFQIQLGEAYRASGQIDAAVRAFQAGVALAPDDATYWNGLGITLAAARRFPEAEQALRTAVARSNGKAEFAYNLSLTLLNQGRFPEGVTELRAIVAREPSFEPARLRLAEVTARMEGRRGPAPRGRPAR